MSQNEVEMHKATQTTKTPLLHHGGLGIFDASGMVYATVGRHQEAHRDEIIRAVNSQAVLLAAAKEALAWLEASFPREDDEPGCCFTLRAAIARSERNEQ